MQVKKAKWKIAAEFLQKHGRITAMDIVKECNTVSPHKFIQILKNKIGLKELETDTPYKIFIMAEPQIKLNL